MTGFPGKKNATDGRQPYFAIGKFFGLHANYRQARLSLPSSRKGLCATIHASPIISPIVNRSAKSAPTIQPTKDFRFGRFRHHWRRESGIFGSAVRERELEFFFPHSRRGGQPGPTTGCTTMGAEADLVKMNCVDACVAANPCYVSCRREYEQRAPMMFAAAGKTGLQ